LVKVHSFAACPPEEKFFPLAWRVSFLAVFVVIVLCGSTVHSQTPTSDSARMVHERRSAGGLEMGHAWRSDGFHGLFFRVFYEAEIDRIFLNAGAFSYRKINDGFGFDFRLRIPTLFYPSGSHTNFSPLAGFSFTVWPDLKATVSAGFPVGIEYEFLIEHFPNVSLGAVASPQINLSAEKNTVIFDVRLGIHFD
jgi:hypothetical protein